MEHGDGMQQRAIALSLSATGTAANAPQQVTSAASPIKKYSSGREAGLAALAAMQAGAAPLVSPPAQPLNRQPVDPCPPTAGAGATRAGAQPKDLNASLATRRGAAAGTTTPGGAVALEKWRAVYKPSELAASRLTAMAEEGCILPTQLKTTYRGVSRSVVYIRWSKFKPAGTDLERKVALLEYCAFIFDQYYEAGERNLIFCYDYSNWSTHQSDPSIVSDVVNISGRYGFDAYNCIVDAPMVFMPLWYTLKAMILPSYVVDKTDFITKMPEGVSYTAAQASCTEWHAAAAPCLRPDGFESRLHAVYLTAKDVSSAAGKEFAIGKAGSNNLLSRSATSYQTRYFKVLQSGDMRTLAYGHSAGFGKAKSVRVLNGADWSMSDVTSKQLTFQLRLVDGQEFNLAMKDKEQVLAFLDACGLC